MTKPICQRTLHGRGAGADIVATVTIGMPHFDSERDCWACPFSVLGVDGGPDQAAYGVDGMQALILAVQGIGKALDATGVRWASAPDEIGLVDDDGLPRFYPMGYGRPLVRRLEAMVDDEMDRATRAGELRRSLKR